MKKQGEKLEIADFAGRRAARRVCRVGVPGIPVQSLRKNDCGREEINME